MNVVYNLYLKSEFYSTNFKRTIVRNYLTYYFTYRSNYLLNSYHDDSLNQMNELHLHLPLDILHFDNPHDTHDDLL